MTRGGRRQEAVRKYKASAWTEYCRCHLERAPMVPRTRGSMEVDAALVQHGSDALIRFFYVHAPVRALEWPRDLVRHLGYPIFMMRHLPLSLIGRFSLALLALAPSTSLRAQSFYPTRPDDSRAVEL